MEDRETARFNAYLSSRGRKAAKIVTILGEHLGDDLSALRALDVGCSVGWIAQALGEYFGFVAGVDPQRDGLIEAAADRGIRSPRFVAGDGAHLPFADELFDVVVYAQVYEHVREQQAVADEIWRVLRPGGVCLFSGPNRFAVIEDHYRLPFLSWLPRRFAGAYLRICRGDRTYDIYPRAYWSLRRMWHRFDVCDYTVKMIVDPARYGVGEHISRARALSSLPRSVLRALTPAYPNYNWILQKNPTPA